MANDDKLRCKGLRDSWEEKVKDEGHMTWRVFLSLIQRRKYDPDDMFVIITCRSSRHTTCGPIINAERYVTYALIMSPCRNIQDTSSIGQRYAILAKKRVDNICGTCVNVTGVRVYVVKMCCTRLSRHVYIRCPVQNFFDLLRAWNFVADYANASLNLITV